MGERKVKLLVADGQQLFAEALGRALARSSDIEVVPDHPATGLAAVQVVDQAAPDVILLDLSIPGMSGVAATHFIRKRNPECRVILLGWFDWHNHIQEVHEAGGFTLQPKSIEVRELVHLIKMAVKAPQSMYPPVEPRDVWQRLITLTNREIEILGILAFGGLEEVAKALSITSGTARIHLSNIMNKMGARSRIEATVLARSHGLIP